MKYVYFINPVKPVILDWDGVEVEPSYVAKFEITTGTYAERYILVDGMLVDKFPGLTDMEAVIKELARLGSPQVVTPPVGFVLTPV